MQPHLVRNMFFRPKRRNDRDYGAKDLKQQKCHKDIVHRSYLDLQSIPAQIYPGWLQPVTSVIKMMMIHRCDQHIKRDI